MNEQFINDLSKELAKLGTIHSVGEEWISYTGKIPSGGIPYCGQEITRETYSALWSWVQAQGLVKTESEWQSIASSQNGNVPFYSSGNGTTTFRMPKLVGYIKGASSKAESGSYVKEGLPNIEGTYIMRGSLGAVITTKTGAFSKTIEGTKQTWGGGSNNAYDLKASFDASDSNSIYGNSNHVTPETSCVLFGVYAFGTVSNPSDLNVSNLASDINSIKTSYLPLSGGNVTGNLTVKGKNVVRSVNGTSADASGNVSISTGITLVSVCPDFTAGVSISTSFTAPSIGWIIGNNGIPRNSECINYVNGMEIAREAGDYADIQILINKGDTFTCTSGADLTRIKFYPCKGA